MTHTTGRVAYAQHQFCARSNEAFAEAAKLGYRIKIKRESRNAKCAAGKHAQHMCDDCQAAETANVQARLRSAEREGTRIIEAGVVLQPKSVDTNAQLAQFVVAFATGLAALLKR